jgi:two-component system CheB/CheR fusion protein
MSPNHSSSRPKPASPQSNGHGTDAESGNEKAPFFLVGVGASAGGFEAFSQLLAHLPANPGLAFILVQHLDPHHESRLPDLLARAARMPVVQAEEGMAVEPDHVYVIPPNASMAVAGGRLRLGPRAEVGGQHLPIDHLFRSLAEDQGGQAIGVVLSGGGTDGTLGLEEIKAAGGITFAQEASSAKHDSMPRSAIGAGCVDFVLPPEGIARELVRIGSFAHARFGVSAAAAAGEDEAFGKICGLLHSAGGVDFAHCQRGTLGRRIQRRMALRNTEQLDEYVRELQHNPAEVQALFQDCLFRVTSFFRDPSAFAALRAHVFPPLLHDRPLQMPLRVWVAGCATGEEAYSLAITLLEFLGERAVNLPIKIFATDVSEAALEKARAGLYIENIALDVAPERLRRFFVQANAYYQIGKAVRDLCVFARHNLVRDPPFSHLDLITCRNVLVQLDPALRKKVLSFFHYALRPGGFLLLGPDETAGSGGELFTLVDTEHPIYVRKAVPSPTPLEFEGGEPARPPTENGGRGVAASRETRFVLEAQREADRLLLARYAPAGVLVDESMTVLQFRGRTGPYLEPAPGAANFNLFKMAREGLLADLRAAFARVLADNRPARKEGILVRTNGSLHPVTLEVIPLPATSSRSRCFLVLFEETAAVSLDLAPAPAREPALPERLDQEGPVLQLSQLQQELDATRQYLQTLVEAHETTNEELKSANEEILSSNEELQSTNEELQTAKEEMQSANEELHTVNDELNNRNREMAQVNDDLVNLLGGVNIPIVMVSRDLRIRRFTPLAERLLNLIPSDVGRPIGDLKPNLNVPNLEQLIVEVIDTLNVKDLEVQDREGHWYSLRIRPYVTADNKIDGAALAAVDIDMLKRSLEQLKQARDYAEAIVETVGEPLVVLDGELRVLRANDAFYRTFQLARPEVEQRYFYKLGGGSWNQPRLRELLEEILPRNARLRDLEFEADFRDLGRRTLLLNAQRIAWEGSGVRMILLALQDVTERKREAENAKLLASEQAARAEAEAANHRKDEFLAMLAHELRNPLAPIRNSIHILRYSDDPDLGVQALELAERQVTHMARLLDDLLDAARLTRGQVRLQKQTVDAGEAVTHAVAAVRQAAEERGHQLEVRVPLAPVILDADPVRLEQVLVNLLSNAIKYTEPGGRIWVMAERQGAEVLLSVRDTGIGIGPELLPRVFEPFVQADRSLERAQGGLGIGLTLVRWLVGLHGGSVQAFSAGPGHGSEFVVRLPALSAAAPPVARPVRTAATERASPAREPAARPRRVLVVDDEPAVAKSLAWVLKVDGHQVRVVHDGASALSAAREQASEVVLLDIAMPGMDGYEVARRLRQTPGLEALRLVALTGYGDEAVRQRTREAGFDDHLVKPVNPDELARLLAQ